MCKASDRPDRQKAIFAACLSAMPRDETSPEELASLILRAAVKAGVGADYEPRTGQSALSIDMSYIMDHRAEGYQSHMAGNAGVGIGKSYAGLANAAARAVLFDERTVYSTKFISLQDQISGKDAPVVSAVTQALTNRTLNVAVVKGWQNYVCTLRAVSLARQLLVVEAH